MFLAHGRRGSLTVEHLHLDGEPAEVVQATVEAAVRALDDDLAAR